MSETEKRLQDMRRAVSGQSAVAKAFLEDEAVRLASEKRSEKYLKLVEDEKSEVPFWVWALLFFILGMLTTLSIPVYSNFLWKLIYPS